ncbi:MAG: hypothetical protein ACP5JN_02865 [Candidatus Micrarchaeia archaeon]
MAIIQKNLDEYQKLSKEDAKLAVENKVKLEYLPLLGMLKKTEESIFSKLEKSGLIGKDKTITIKVPLAGATAYIEQFEYSDTLLSKISKQRVEGPESLAQFRQRVKEANEMAAEISSKFGAVPTRLYFGVLRRAAKAGDEEARAALDELYSKNLIEIVPKESIDTRNVDMPSLIAEAKRVDGTIVQEKLDIYADESFSISIISIEVAKYLRIKSRLDRVKNEIFEIVWEYKLLDIGMSMRIETEYGKVYIGIYDEIKYNREGEKEIKEVLSKHNFSRGEYESLDISKIMRNKKYEGLRKELLDALMEAHYLEQVNERRIWLREDTEEKKLKRE